MTGSAGMGRTLTRPFGRLCGGPLCWGLLCWGLLAAGCSWFGGSGAQPQTPDGFRRASAELVAFARPEGWRALPAGAYPQGWAAAFEKRAGGQSVAQVAVFQKLPTTSDPYIAAEAAITGVEQNSEDMRRTGQREVEVAGSAGALRIDYRYSAVSQGTPTGETILGTDVTAVDEAGRAATVRITRVQGKLADRVVGQIVDSIEMHPRQ
ncbi:MAG: hypothetical protein GEV03_01410 [Streptosporangiales bacterium]|nr:hypothetical protein [Streptosporangiales bacterium]